MPVSIYLLLYFYVDSFLYSNNPLLSSGESLYKLCRGQDDRQLRPDQPRQSVSCDVNYGIRLTDAHQVELLFENIAAEVSKKLRNARLLSKQVNGKKSLQSLEVSVLHKW